jgi:hypothetical protein
VEEELILTVGKREAEVSVAARCSKGGIREIRKKKRSWTPVHGLTPLSSGETKTSCEK